MVRIRLRRVGLRNQASYRIVVANIESPRDGRFLEIVGFYNPRTDPSTVDVKEDRVYEWLSKGAQPSESVVKIFNIDSFDGSLCPFQSGEPVETLVAEATKAREAQVISPKTRPVLSA